MPHAQSSPDHTEQLIELEQLSRQIIDAESEVAELHAERRQAIGALHGAVSVEVLAAAAGITRQHVHRLVRSNSGR